ncbi:hypothetical protein FHR84_001842 [Actinopolyspora biskrensis]|uniref:Uncharacterized protein n=1 Tax=Actinopolyspora biskrensis TaxID=1470178 RepID=A0A852Z7S7_9ACTN|nr:hypothetical protein [Actinopolyspora biskrensis]NYH78517.1 hypothetical protein [Actinopolyspora biskrensis]
MSTHPAMLLSTVVLLAGTAVVLGVWGNRVSYRPRHAGGSGGAARRLAALQPESLFRPEQPTTESIRWPPHDPDRRPHLFGLGPPRPGTPSAPPEPAAPAPAANVGSGADRESEHPELVLMRRVLDGLHRLR